MGGQYYDPKFSQSTGIIHEIKTPYTSQHNGVAKGKNSTLIEMDNAMLYKSSLSEGF